MAFNTLTLNKVLYSLNEAVNITGESKRSLREGCKNGTIPHIRRGEGENARFLINLPLYIDQLNKESRDNAHELSD